MGIEWRTIIVVANCRNLLFKSDVARITDSENVLI